MEEELICNYRKCRKRLTSFAWVTSCSHIFCDADGTREFKNSLVCPACDNTLTGKLDVIRVDLKPSEQFKSIVLCGNKPETIMEICTRALSFWNYQERVYLEHVSTKAKEKAAQLEQYYEQVVNRLQAELSALKSQITSAKKKHEFYENKCKEINAKLTEKTRQHQKLQALYDTLRRRCVTPSTFNAGKEDTVDFKEEHSVHNFLMVPFASREAPGQTNDHAPVGRGHPQLGNGCLTTGMRNTPRLSPPEREFTVRPNHTPVVDDPRTSILAARNFTGPQ
ncbi:E3 ubiquitin-protein ligase CCNB1IP1-like isoform X2 [Pomacea canaliculata]|uniref:E3 ubiquitin-protein ligase CCNB1IP1-like isoform X2 n=1 Tax=Pomacea canaliculata TaxID=400727 RepID=UPI000D7395DA|nr:E3 ubiquitin-protein ligase CCNB1IP1-like isoform X2 [Pomacea canaliculata]